MNHSNYYNDIFPDRVEVKFYWALFSNTAVVVTTNSSSFEILYFPTAQIRKSGMMRPQVSGLCSPPITSTYLI